MKKKSTFLKSAIVLMAFSLFPLSTSATEGGVGHYVPGAMATLIDLLPTKTGWVVEPMYLHYKGDVGIGQDIPVAGLNTLGLNAKSDAFLIGGFYTITQPVLGATYSIGAFLPYIWMDVDAEVVSVIGNRKVNDKKNGIGDMSFFPVMMAWKEGAWQFNGALGVYAPTGEYKTGDLANTGLNYWSFDPIVGVSYNHPELGFNAALYGGITFNTENNDTDYQSGSMAHLDGSVQQLLPLGHGFVSIGAEGFYLQQLDADSGQRKIFGDFKGRTAGIGPVLGYMLPVGEDTLAIELRWLSEMDTKNRLEGDYTWLKVVYQF